MLAFLKFEAGIALRKNEKVSGPAQFVASFDRSGLQFYVKDFLNPLLRRGSRDQ
jgi:hypothetical protein